MSNSEKEFRKYLKVLITDLHQINPNKNIETIIKVFNKLNIKKVSSRFNNLLLKYNKLIDSKNEELFENDLMILPNINLKEYWSLFNDEKKKRLWSVINVLYVLSSILVSQEYNKDTNNVKDNEFNPYVGLKNNDEKFGITEMFGGPKDLPNEEKKGNGVLGNMANMANMANLANIPNLSNIKNLGDLKNLEKLIDMKKFSEDIKNINKDEIIEATGNIKKLLGKNADEKTSNLLSDMLDNITNELQGNNLGDGDPISNIMKVAEKVASKMKPRIESENINLENVVNGSELGGNPMNLFHQLMKQNSKNDSNTNTHNKSLKK